MVLKINGIEIKAPKTLQVDIMDVDSQSNRNANGYLYRDRLCSKIKLNCEWPPMKNEEISVLLQAVKDVFFEVTFPNPFTGTFDTKTMYVGDRSMPVYSCINSVPFWNGCSMNFIER